MAGQQGSEISGPKLPRYTTSALQPAFFTSSSACTIWISLSTMQTGHSYTPSLPYFFGIGLHQGFSPVDGEGFRKQSRETATTPTLTSGVLFIFSSPPFRKIVRTICAFIIAQNRKKARAFSGKGDKTHSGKRAAQGGVPGFFQSEARGCVRIRRKLERRAVFVETGAGLCYTEAKKGAMER